MEGLESSMLNFILEQTMRMTHEKSLALCLLHILTGLFSVLLHFLWVLQSPLCLDLFSCVSFTPYPETQRILLAQDPQVLFGIVPLSFPPKGGKYSSVKYQGKYAPSLHQATKCYKSEKHIHLLS